VPSWDEFSQDGAADGLRPGPWLAALAGEAVADLGRLDEGQLLGVGSAARRLAAHAGYLELMAVAEFARRRDAQLEASKARGDRVRSRDGEYPAEELGFEMTATAYRARRHDLDHALGTDLHHPPHPVRRITLPHVRLRSHQGCAEPPAIS